MSDQHKNGRAAAEHAARCLRMDPCWQAGEVLEARRAWLGLRSTAADGAIEANRFADRRGKVQRRLKKLRADAWSTDPTASLERLTLLDAEILKENPDLLELTDQLKQVAFARAATPDLCDERGYDEGFFEAFQVALTGTPQQAAETRQQMVVAFRDKALRRRGVGAIRLLRTKAPHLYALDAPFLDALLKRGRGQRLSGQSRGEPSQSEHIPVPGQANGTKVGCIWYVIGFVILSNVIRAINLLQGE